MTAEEVVASARACVGARFRPQGRDVATGLDCIGVAAIALGREPPAAGYALRGNRLSDISAAARDMGLENIRVAEARPGDVAIMRAGPGQLHLIVLTPAGFVHADARLRRVVEVPGGPPWPMLAAWRGTDERN